MTQPNSYMATPWFRTTGDPFYHLKIGTIPYLSTILHNLRWIIIRKTILITLILYLICVFADAMITLLPLCIKLIIRMTQTHSITSNNSLTYNINRSLCMVFLAHLTLETYRQHQNSAATAGQYTKSYTIATFSESSPNRLNNHHYPLILTAQCHNHLHTTRRLTPAPY